MATHSDFVDLIETIYDSALEPSRWVPTLYRIGNYLNANGGLLIGFSWTGEKVSLQEAAPNDPAFQEMYHTKYLRNPWGDRAILRPTGLGFTTDSLIDLKSLEHTQYYQEHLKPQEVIHGAVACLAGNRDFIVGCTIHRSARQGPFDAVEMERWQAIIPHLQRAVQLQLRAEGWDPLRSGARQALDQLALGILLLASNGTLLFANEAAARIIETRCGIFIKGEQIQLADPAAAARLRRLIVDARTPGRTRQFGGSAIAVPRDGRLPLQLLVGPLVGDSRSILPDASVVIFIHDPERSIQPRPQWLIDLYGLTPAESRVAITITNGSGVTRTAAYLGVSVNTLKTQLAQVFAKTGTRNQTELVALLSGMFAAVS